MPQIPIPTAQRSPTVLQLPNVSPNSFGAQAGEQISQFGQALERTAFHLQAQQDELQLTAMAGQLDLAVDAAKQSALQHPVLAARPGIFEDGMNAARETIEKGTQSTAVQRALLAHQYRIVPQAVIQLQHESMVRLKGENDTMLFKELDNTAREIPTMSDPVMREEALMRIRTHLERSKQSGLMTPLDAEKTWSKFKLDVLENNMDYLRQTNPTKMQELDRQGAFAELDPMKRLKVLSDASKDVEHAETVNEKNFKKLQDAWNADWSARANLGQLSVFEQTQALAGLHPFITSDKAREYAKINANPPDVGGASTPIRVIVQEYHGKPITRQNIEVTRKKLNATARELGVPSPLLDKALNELQADEMSMRGVDAAEMTAKIQYAKDRHTAEADQKLPGMIGTMQKNQEQIEQAEIQMRIRKGEKPDAVLDDIKKRHEAKKKAVPERSKGVLDLLK